MKDWVTKYMENCEQCHHNAMIARTASPTTTSLHSKIREMQEQHRATMENEVHYTQLLKKSMRSKATG